MVVLQVRGPRGRAGTFCNPPGILTAAPAILSSWLMNSFSAALLLTLGHAPAATPPRIFVGGLVALSAWCLGHGILTSEAIDLALAARFSLAHATGLGLIALVAFHTQRRAWPVRSIAALMIGLAGSVLVADVGLHG